MPIKITINYMGQLRKAFGVSSEQCEVPAPIAPRELFVQRVHKLTQPASIQLLTPDQTPSSALLLFVNGEQQEWAEDIRLNNGDEITVLAPLAGG